MDLEHPTAGREAKGKRGKPREAEDGMPQHEDTPNVEFVKIKSIKPWAIFFLLSKLSFPLSFSFINLGSTVVLLMGLFPAIAKRSETIVNTIIN